MMNSSARRYATALVLLAGACNDAGHAGDASSGGGGTDTTATTGGTGSGGTQSSGATGSASDTGATDGTTEEPKFDVGGSLDVPGGDPGIPETCAQAVDSESTVGCEFYAVDMDLVVVYDQQQYAVAVANVQLAQEATVTVEADDGAGWTVVAGPETVPAMGLFTFELPDRHQDNTGIRFGGAYRIVSDVPIIAYQFEPLEAEESFTSDASLLYPTHAWDTLHYVLNQPRINTAQSSYFTILAGEDGTVVTITPSVDTSAGGGVQAGLAGEAFDVMIDDGDLLQVAVAHEGDDPTGTRIESNEDHPVAVFSGNTCSLIPEGSGACDHLQDQMFGVRLWGTSFVASRVPVRSTENKAEPSLWQIFANEEETEVTFTADAAVTGVPASPQMLQPGDVLEFMVDGPFENPGDFLIDSTKPIAVANYMTGSTTVMPLQEPTLGDPSQVQLAPREQFLPRYVILVPTTWLYDVVTITRLAGSEIRIGGTAVDDAEFIAVGGTYEVARIPVEDGIHALDGDDPFSVVVTGYDDDDSYVYLGGAGTAVINPTPEG